ncbi:ABC transporter permease [Bradyrhizobium sp. SYSU BS000235]|uniref:ABC transporter permease n=1 Tax=Bradyrhizobium sp. SYSU BS000235 TaxID=3411332 RepID=UPI003C778A06
MSLLHPSPAFRLRSAPHYATTLAITDLLDGLKLWRIWVMLALNDVNLRYRRSRIGQFWLTISMAVTILALGFVYSTIFQIELKAYLPLLAYSLIIWSLIAGICNEGAGAFIEAEGYIRSAPWPKSIYVYRVLFRNFLFLLHNMILVPVVMLVFGLTPTPELLYFIPALALTLLTGVWISLLLGIFSARFRDLPPMIAAFMQIAFFLSPIMWTSSQLRGQFSMLIACNPFAAFLTILRDPLLGNPPEPGAWISATVLAVVGFLVTLPFYARFRSRISFYV